MSDTPEPAPLDVRPGKPSLIRRLSFVWLVPVIALALSLGVAYQNYANQGVLIEISFENASGVAADETQIKFRDVVVGMVERVEFAPGLGDVVVEARVDPEIAAYLDDDAFFWVVRPDVSVRGITGLDTVLSGVYIEGTWDTDAGVLQTEFVGLEEPPLVRANQDGTFLLLRTDDGSALTAGAPVLHKGIAVGYLEQPRLSPNGQTVTVGAFVEAPYDRRITTATRFWDTSGFSVSLGAGGVSLNVNSLASLIEGGIAFDTVVSGGAAVENGQIFDLFDDEQTARSSLFNDPDRPRLNVAVLFDGSVSGLSVGSEVRFQGIRIGEVAELNAVVVDDNQDTLVQLRTVLSIEPGRLGLGEEATPDDALEFLAEFVRQGLRARMVTGNILSGSLVVELVEMPDAPRNFIDLGAEPYPILPSTESNLTDVAEEAEGLLDRVDSLPIEELLQGAIDLMDSLERLARSPDVMQVPEELVSLLEDARGLVGSDDIQAVPSELRAIVAQVDAIVAEAAAADLVDRVGAVLDSSGRAAANIDIATQGLPELTAEVEALVAKANALELETLIAEATQTLDGIETLIASEALQNAPAAVVALVDEAQALLSSADTQAIPTDLRRVIGDIDAILTEARENDLVGQLSETIATANSAVANIDSASEGLPAITTELQALAEKANALDLTGLVTEATATLDSIDRLVGSQSTQELPASVSAALDEMRLFLSEVREGGAVENVNAALASANQAAQAIEEAVAGLPALSARASALVSETSTVLGSYGERSRFNAETLATLRDIQEAADAVSALARAIQRNPNSLLVGR